MKINLIKDECGGCSGDAPMLSQNVGQVGSTQNLGETKSPGYMKNKKPKVKKNGKAKQAGY